jgi:hypothetical protein
MNFLGTQTPWTMSCLVSGSDDVIWLSLGWVRGLGQVFATIDVVFRCHKKPSAPTAKAVRQKNMKIELMMVIGVLVMSHSCHDLLVAGAGVAVCHSRWASSALNSSVGGGRASTGSLHLALGVLVHEASVAWQVGGRRGRHGERSGTVIRSTGHDEGGCLVWWVSWGGEVVLKLSAYESR